MKFQKAVAGMAVTLALVSCSQTSKEPLPPVNAAETSLRWVVFLMRGGGLEYRPTALLGTYASSYLAQGTSLSRSAIVGAIQQIALFFEKMQQQNESYQLLQDLGSALAVNIQDMLNRSPNRAKDLDTYVSALKVLQANAQRQQEGLDGKRKAAEDDLRTKRKDLSAIQRQLATAVREKDYVTAGSLQDGLNESQKIVSEAEGEVKELRNILDLYKDILKLAGTRITAIVANREVLIAGVKLVDVPGISEIGVLQGDSTRIRNR